MKEQKMDKYENTRRLHKFYEGKNILITGATGFIGKVCLVKLMHSLKGCAKVYVMLRAKKGMTPEQRFKKLLSEEPFAPPANGGLDEENPNAFPEWNRGKENGKRQKKGIMGAQLRAIDWSRVIPIEGDITLDDLGFSSEIRELLCKSVDIVLHIAASVSFDAPLRQNLRDNYEGSRNLLQLALNFERLVSYVHVSTFYSNSHLSHIEEKVIPLERECTQSASLITSFPENVIEKITPDMLENRPNTYIYTKAMAENLVMKYEGILPLAIVRPSIVMPALEEPYPGWIDNVNGPMGLIALAGLGIVRNIDWNYDGVVDLIPVDYVVNSILVIAERTARLPPNRIMVYNCSSSSLKPITWGQTFEQLRLTHRQAPPYKMMRMPISVPTHNRASRTGILASRMSELLFAIFVDLLLFIFGQKPILRKITYKLHHGYKILKPFTTKAYSCSNENLLAAYDELHPEDKDEFCFQPENIVWLEWLKHSWYGIRRLLLKEDPANIPAARIKMKLQWVVEFLFRVLFYFLMSITLYKTCAFILSRF